MTVRSYNEKKENKLMNNGWPMVALEEVLTQDKEYIEAPEPKVYPKLSVKLYGKGVVLDSPADGSLLKMKRHQIAKSGQVILSEIWGKKGAIGFVPSEGEGALCTSHFFLFDVNKNRIDPRYLQAIFTANYLEEQLGADAKGTTGYAAVRPKNLLAAKIPLPPLEEQQRIVARIEELAAKVEEARGLRKKTKQDIEKLLIAMAHRYDLSHEDKLKAGWEEVMLRDVIRQSQEVHDVEAEKSYPNFGLYNFARGPFLKPPIHGFATSAQTLNRVRKGQFIYNRLFAFEGAYCMVFDEYDGFFVSNEYPTFECDSNRVIAEYLYAYFKSPAVWAQLASKSKGLGDRRQRLQPKDMLQHRLILPPVEYQQRIARSLKEGLALQQLQAETAAELDALMPAILDRAFKGML